MVQIEDTASESVNTENVFYDLQTGDYGVFSLDGNTLIIRNVFTGDKYYEWDVDEFQAEEYASEFRKVDGKPVTNPVAVIDEVISSILMGYRDPFAGYESWEVRFAWASIDDERVDFAVDFS